MKRVFYFAYSLLFLIVVSCSSPQGEDSQLEAGMVKSEQASSSSYSSDKYLIDASDAKKVMEMEENVAVIEVSKTEDYESGHLPGAFNIWRPMYENRTEYSYGGMMATKEQMQDLLTRMGISPETKIIIYDVKGNVDASRFMWILRSYGHENLKLINGGKTGWTDAGFTLSKEPAKLVAAATPYAFDDRKAYKTISASQKDVLNALNDPDVILVDTRTLDEYTGKMLKNGAAKAGRIPGSIHIDWANAVDYDGTFKFKTVEELRQLYESKGVTKDKKIIAYCHTGVRSAHTQFVLSELLGYKDVINYDGSWTEWSQSDDLPFEINPTEDLVGTPSAD